MQQLTFIRRGRLEWREVPEPKLEEPGDVLVRPLAVARCDLDAAMLFGKLPLRGPFALGHEFVAEVMTCGEAVTKFQPGQKVVVPFQISCGSCPRCQTKLTGRCTTVPPGSLSIAGAMYGLGAAGGHWGGALSDMVRVPYADHMLVPIPSGIDYRSLASASDNLPDAWRAVGPYLKQQPGASVLVVGGGAVSIGLYAVAIAVALGSKQVDYFDDDPERLQLAESLGANPKEGSVPEHAGSYPITVDASTNAVGLAGAIRSVEPGGVCTSVSIYFGQDVPLPLLQMYVTGITFRTGRANVRADIPEIISLVQSGQLQPERITTKLARWEDACEALFDPSAKVVIARD